MSSHLSLSPADLDRLEDALEGLGLDGIGDDLDGADGLDGADDPVAKRLAEFREILQLSREALPIEEVPAGLLDGVMAEARQAGAAATAVASEKGSFWSRWRLSVWVPTLAFAGSAALLLMVLVPKGADEPAAVAQAKDDQKVQANDDDQGLADGRLAQSELGRLDTEADGVARGQGGLPIGERAPDPAAAADPMPADEAEPERVEELSPEPDLDADDDEVASAPKSKRRKSASGSSSSAGAMPKPSPVPSAPAGKAPSSAGGLGKGGGLPGSGLPGGTGDDAKKEDKKDASDPWSELSRADADRRGGNCGLAKMRYDKVRKSDDTKARARALAGLGLCAAESGSMGTAKKLFAQARDADPGVSGFIDRELAAIETAPANADEASQVQSYD